MPKKTKAMVLICGGRCPFCESNSVAMDDELYFESPGKIKNLGHCNACCAGWIGTYELTNLANVLGKKIKVQKGRSDG